MVGVSRGRSGRNPFCLLCLGEGGVASGFSVGLDSPLVVVVVADDEVVDVDGVEILEVGVCEVGVWLRRGRKGIFG